MGRFFYSLNRADFRTCCESFFFFFQSLVCLNSKNLRGLLIWKESRNGNQLKQISERDTMGHKKTKKNCYEEIFDKLCYNE